jgi:hypothetical protein
VGCKTLYLRNGAVCVEYDKVAVVLNGICCYISLDNKKIIYSELTVQPAQNIDHL